MDSATLEARRKGVGGSDIGKIMGLSPKWGNAYSVYASKVGLDKTFVPKFSLPREYGTLVEDSILKLWKMFRESKGDVVLCQTDVPTVVDGIRIANLDSVVTVNGEVRVADVKTSKVATSGSWGKPGTGDMPAGYKAQLNWYMGITGIHKSMIIREMDHDISEYFHDFDAVYFAMQCAAAQDFWDGYVVPQIPPPVDNSDVATWLLEKTYSTPSEEKREPTAEDMPAIVELAIAQREKKAAEIRYDTAKNAVKKRIADASGIKGDFGYVTWSRKNNSLRASIKEHWNPEEEPLNG